MTAAPRPSVPQKASKAYRRIKVEAWECRCQRCGHQWQTLGETPPVSCSACKSKSWTFPADPSKPGRRKRE